MKTVSVNVAGRTFQIRSDAKQDHVRKLAALVTERYNAIEKRGPRGDQEFRTMAMVAIVLLDELLEAEKRRDIVRDQARSFARKMISKIDDILSRSGS
jgi:cell division protein ZapA (FtsZ GTPase activity inhibitor)